MDWWAARRQAKAIVSGGVILAWQLTWQLWLVLHLTIRVRMSFPASAALGASVAHGHRYQVGQVAVRDQGR